MIRLPAVSVHRGRNLSPAKELRATLHAVLTRKRHLIEPLTIRWYCGRSHNATTLWCSFWLRTSDGREISGTGQVGGAGYDKRLASLRAAAINAAITLPREDFRDAEALALRLLRAAGYRAKPLLIRNQ